MDRALNDNTVGPIFLTSGNGSDMLPYSAEHVQNISTMLNNTPPVHSNLVIRDEGLFLARLVSLTRIPISR